MFKLPGLSAIDHRFQLPLDHAKPEGETIEIFAREFVAPGAGKETRPWLVGYAETRPGGAPHSLTAPAYDDGSAQTSTSKSMSA